MFQVKGVLWLLVVPVMVNIALFAGAIFVLVTKFIPWIVELIGNGGGRWYELTLEWIVIILLTLIFLVVYAFLFSIIAEIIGAPFYEEIGARVDKNHKVQIVERPWYKEVVMTISQEAQKLVALGGIMILMFFMQFIPVLGQLVSASLGFGLLVLTLGADSVGPALYRRGLVLGARRKWVIRNWLPVVGMGMAKALGLIIPVLNIIVLPVSAAGGTLLVQKYDTK